MTPFEKAMQEEQDDDCSPEKKTEKKTEIMRIIGDLGCNCSVTVARIFTLGFNALQLSQHQSDCGKDECQVTKMLEACLRESLSGLDGKTIDEIVEDYKEAIKKRQT